MTSGRISLAGLFPDCIQEVDAFGLGRTCRIGKDPQVEGSRLFSEVEAILSPVRIFLSGRGSLIIIDGIFPNRQSRGLNMCKAICSEALKSITPVASP